MFGLTALALLFGGRSNGIGGWHRGGSSCQMNVSAVAGQQMRAGSHPGVGIAITGPKFGLDGDLGGQLGSQLAVAATTEIAFVVCKVHCCGVCVRKRWMLLATYNTLFVTAVASWSQPMLPLFLSLFFS